MTGADLYAANLERANLEDADLLDTNLIDVKNLTPSQIKSANFWEDAIYQGYFDEEKLKWVVFEEFNQQFIERIR